MLGFGALGEFALGEGPTPKTFLAGSQWAAPVKRTGLAVAIVAGSFTGFVPPPPAQAKGQFTQFAQPAAKKPQLASWHFTAPAPQAQTAIFSAFSQPFAPRIMLPDEQPSVLFEVLPPVLPPFTGFASFDIPLQAKVNIAIHVGRWWGPITLPVDTHDGVWIKKKRKKPDRDPIDLELEERAKRRAAIELAVYGPEVTYEPQPSIIKTHAPIPPPNVEDLAKTIVALRTAEIEAQRKAIEQDDEDVLEMILRDL